MYIKPTTLTEFILEEERKHKNATGNLTLLLTQIENAAKIIASHIKKSGLVDIIGKTGTKNFSQDEVRKIDTFSNDLLIKTLTLSGQVATLASEEMKYAITIDKNGHYNVFFDPLDGSSNIDSGITVGTIFSIYRNSGQLFQPGKNQVAAGYVLYGTSVIFVYTSGDGVNGFTLDPSIGSFLLSHPNITIPKKGSIYSINEGYSPFWENNITTFINACKQKGYNSRYVGGLVPDAHRTLIKGGIFLYPANTKHPEGKLRLMYEVNPFAFIISQAGGKAVSKTLNPLSLIPKSLHQKVPIVLGSPDSVEMYLSHTD